MHILDEPVSLPWNCDNVALLLRLAEGFAKHEDIAADISLFDKCAGPNRLHQVVFSHDLFAVANENQKNLKGFGCQRDRLSLAKQHLLVRINPKGPEGIKFPALRGNPRGHWNTTLAVCC